MARARYFDHAQLPDALGFIKKVANPTVTVYDAGTTTPYTAGPIYAADTGGTTLTNPFTGGANGEIEFYLTNPGRVSIKVDGAPTYGSATQNMQPVWPDPASLNSTIWSPNGLYSATISDAGVFTAPGLLRSFRTWRVADYLTTGISPGLAATNTTALIALHAEVAAAGRGKLDFAGETYSLNATALTAAVPSGLQCDWEGGGRNGSLLRFYGNGPFLNFSPSSGSLQRWEMKGFLIQHDSVSTSGAALKFSGACHKIDLIDVEIAAGGFLTGIETAHVTEMVLERCKINTRTDYTTLVDGALTPVALDLVNTATMGGLYLHHTELGCCGIDVNPVARGNILRFNNTGWIDTVVIGDGCHLIGGGVGILKSSGTGNVSNVLIGKAFVTDTEVAEQFEPPTGSTVENIIHTGTWLEGRSYCVLATESNGGVVRDLAYTGGYLTNATVRGMLFGPGVNGIELTGNKILTSVSAAGRSGVEIGDNSTPSQDVTFVGGRVTVGGAADAAYTIGSAVDALTVMGVTQRGAAGVVNGALDASRVHVPGAFLV